MRRGQSRMTALGRWVERCHAAGTEPHDSARPVGGALSCGGDRAALFCVAAADAGAIRATVIQPSLYIGATTAWLQAARMPRSSVARPQHPPRLEAFAPERSPKRSRRTVIMIAVRKGGGQRGGHVQDATSEQVPPGRRAPAIAKVTDHRQSHPDDKARHPAA